MNGSLCSNIVFKKEVILTQSNTSAEVFYYANERRQSNATIVFLLSLFSCGFDGQLHPNVHTGLFYALCWDAPIVNTGL